MRSDELVVIAWAPTSGRAHDLAADLGGTALVIYPRRLSDRRLTPLRYVASAALTVSGLLRHRPHAIIVQNPPVYPAVISGAWAAATGATFVLDNHPTSFGAKGNRQSEVMLSVTRWLARRADAVLVTTTSWVDVVTAWGGRGLVVHEAPPRWTVPTARPLAARRPRLLFACVFASDEPVAEVIDMARELPDIDVVITGDPRRAPAGILEGLPTNVTLTGWLDQPAYVEEVSRCDVLLALTTEPTSVMRAAYEAVLAERVLIMSDSKEMRTALPGAVTTTLPDLQDTVRWALSRHAELRAELPALRRTALENWQRQRADVTRALGLEPATDGHPPEPSAALAAPAQPAVSEQRAAPPQPAASEQPAGPLVSTEVVGS